MRTKFAIGQKVKYKHGPGYSTGTIQTIEDGKATLKTRRGFSVVRPLTNLKKGNPAA